MLYEISTVVALRPLWKIIPLLSGIAPVVESSGKQHWVHFRRSCPKFLRRTFHEWALHSIAGSAWAKDYYRQHRANGQSHHSAVRALAFKWIRILFRCWHDRTLYDEASYGNLRRQRAHNNVDSAVQVQWKTCAGFNRLSLQTS